MRPMRNVHAIHCIAWTCPFSFFGYASTSTLKWRELHASFLVWRMFLKDEFIKE
ncbi:hypothetical protein [Dysgonomonas capnocytophagoides]|uniref:hypothetical protein n=1 Tax=Dysgonomonas capnocytophagoides TaxID=45254 RepID=UPI002A8355E8|nr:hypothetical protein [Dysgonomonas capnocytophagoides]